MAQDRSDLPQGTESSAGSSITASPDSSPGESRTGAAGKSISRTATGDGEGSSASLTERLRDSGETLTEQAAGKARELVGQGLERSAETLASVSRMVGDTAEGIDERLGLDYGDYARRAATAIENTANSIASKDPEELIEDTRNFVRRSPGVAIAGAAIIGFALIRLVKSTLSSNDDQDGGKSGR